MSVKGRIAQVGTSGVVTQGSLLLLEDVRLLVSPDSVAPVSCWLRKGYFYLLPKGGNLGRG